MTSIPIALQDWAIRWALPAECLADLLRCMCPPPAPPTGAGAPPSEASESWAQSAVRLEAPRFGVWLTRNNVGARTITEDDGTRRHLRWGLANESKQQNEVLKSADLIGIRAVTVTASMVGVTIGQFVSREIKKPGWTYSGDAHETAQMTWAQLITRYGGDAKFATGEGSFTT